MDLWGQQAGQPIFVSEDLKKMTIDVLGETILGSDFDTLGGSNDNPLASYRHAIENIFHLPTLLIPGYQKLPFPRNKKLAAEINNFDSFIWDIIERKKKEKKDTPENLVECLIHANQNPDEGVTPMTDQMLRDNIVLFFIAGHETTAVSLMFALHQLAAYPEVQKRAREEAFEVFPDGILTYEGMLQLKYISAIIKEVMRLYPPAPIIGFRQINQEEGAKLGPYHLPNKTLVLPMIYAMHTDPRYWKNPLAFNPDRWLSGETTENKGVYLPFSSGGRVCIGNNFSLLEQKVFVASLLTRFQVSLPPDKTELVIKKGVTFILEPDPDHLAIVLSEL